MTQVDAVEPNRSSFPGRDHLSSAREESLRDALDNDLHKLHRIAVRTLRNTHDAEDAVQDALLSAYKNLSQFKGESQMTTWLTTIVLNSSRMFLRRQAAHRMVSLNGLGGETGAKLEDFLGDPAPTPEELYRKTELRRALQRIARRLSPKIRAAFRLIVLDGLSMQEAAQTLGIPLGTRGLAVRFMRESKARRSPGDLRNTIR